MKFVRFLVVAGCLLVAAAAQAGTIHPALQAEMDRTAPTLPISAIVFMADQAPIASLNQDLKARGATLQERHREVVEALQAAADRSQGPLVQTLDDAMQRGTVDGYTTYWIANLIVISALRQEIESIAARADVEMVERNFTTGLINPIGGIPQMSNLEVGGDRAIGVPPGIRAIRAPEVWYQLGYTGAGRLIANLDTGVDGNHPALRTRWRGYQGQNPWQECWLDLLGTNTTFPVDTYGHGTHVMGTMTGQAPNDSIGVSPGSQWIACNAINQGVSQAFDQDIITAYQWYADPDGNPNTNDDVPDVVQNSWGINEGFSQNPPYVDCDTRWWAVLDNCSAAGVVVTWSAGNEGPGAGSLRSPADRATTLFEAFSVGAVDATNYNWPYPIASFSSRGPSGCNVPPAQKIKPEVVAPGVDVYSSVPGGGYSQSYSGTSMAGPHAGGIVGLIRQANPNLDVDTIKGILMQTARDEGTAGEENTYGWGFVDAYAAVIAATVGFGTIDGFVYNESYNNTPIPGATVKLIDTGHTFTTDGLGHYSGSAPAGTHPAVASRTGFEPETTLVVIQQNQATHQNFTLIDNAGPEITNVSDPQRTTDTVGPYTIQATVNDLSTVTGVKLYYRLNGGGWIEQVMNPVLGNYAANIPGMPTGTQIDFYVWAQDGGGLTATSPANAPNTFYSIFITSVVYAYDVESAGGWQLGAPGDLADAGLWIQADPIGTVYNGQVIQCEDDHTPNPGVQCFITGNGAVGGAAGEQDVDHGCTTLLSPVFDLSAATQAFINYHRWYGEGGNSTDDEFAVDVSSDGGSTWAALERVPDNDTNWRMVTKNIGAVVGITSQVQFRFVACDLNTGGLVEAGIDDVSLETFVPNPADVPASGLVLHSDLAQSEPNPANPTTMIRFRLSNPGEATLGIFDASGRHIRALASGRMTAGAHQIAWDGLDDAGNPVGSGVYFYRLTSGDYQQSRRMTILR